MTTEERIAKLEKELAELKAEIKQEETEDDMPCAGDIYHMITSKGTIALYEWSDCPFDKHCYEIGNCFMSIEDAEFALEKLKVIHELKQFAEPKKKAWDSEDGHFYIDNGDCWESRDKELLAWMPLPPSYQGEENG